jgi:hypothetical protein
MKTKRTPGEVPGRSPFPAGRKCAVLPPRKSGALGPDSCDFQVKGRASARECPRALAFPSRPQVRRSAPTKERCAWTGHLCLRAVSCVISKVEGRTNAREVSPGARLPSPPRDAPFCPHERTARRTGHLSPQAAAPGGGVRQLCGRDPRRGGCRHLDVTLGDDPAAAFQDAGGARVAGEDWCCECEDAEDRGAQRERAGRDRPTLLELAPLRSGGARRSDGGGRLGGAGGFHCGGFSSPRTKRPAPPACAGGGRFRSGSPQAQATNVALADRCLPDGAGVACSGCRLVPAPAVLLGGDCVQWLDITTESGGSQATQSELCPRSHKLAGCSR